MKIRRKSISLLDNKEPLYNELHKYETLIQSGLGNTKT